MGVASSMKKVVVRGPALSQSGYGEHTRFVLRALRSKPELFDVYLLNIPWGNTGWIWEDNEDRQWIDFILSDGDLARRRDHRSPSHSPQRDASQGWVGQPPMIRSRKINPGELISRKFPRDSRVDRDE